MKTFHQFITEAQEVGIRSAVTSGTVGGDKGFQARQQQGVNKFVKKGGKVIGSLAKSGAGVAAGTAVLGAKVAGAAVKAGAKGVKGAAKLGAKGIKGATEAGAKGASALKSKIASMKKDAAQKTKPEQEVKKVNVKVLDNKKPVASLPAAKPTKTEPAKPEPTKAKVAEPKKKMVKSTKLLPAAEAYDPEVVGRSQIRKTGEGGRIGAERKKSEPERRRMKAVGGGKTAPVGYKDRKDIGQQRERSTREQQPTQERGSAASAQAAAAKEARKKAALARIAAKKGGAKPEAEKKEKSKDVSKQATKLLSTKKPEKKVDPRYKPQKASGMTRPERMSQQRKGEAALKDIMKQQEFSRYEKETGQKATGKAKTKLLGRVAKRMAN